MKSRRNIRAGLIYCLAGCVGIGLAGCGQDAPSSSALENTSPTKPVRENSSANEKKAIHKQPKQRQTTSPNDSQTPQQRASAMTTEIAHTSKAAGIDTSIADAETRRQAVQPVFRPADTRPRHDDTRLAEIGIFKYESKRLKLYTDIDPESAKSLPRLIDLAYEALEEYFGPLPPNRRRTEYQMTGYLMVDKELYRRMNLLPADLLGVLHGRHRGAEFWMNEQKHAYYRRHLMIHEATHCFMTTMPDVRAPVWYLEGMAELFGTHWLDPEGNAHFRVMPFDQQNFVGLGRITMIQNDVKAGRLKSISDLAALEPGNFYLKDESYAWSWALCKFFDAHPRYHKAFRQLGRQTVGSQFAAAFREFLNRERPELQTRWLLFAAGLEDGYDVERAVIDFRPGSRLDAGSAPARIDLATNRGWQSSGLLVQKGHNYLVTASARFTLAQKPKPWISEPQGISFLYAGGRPLGMLLATIHSAQPTKTESMLHVIPIGRQQQFEAPFSGTLHFRVNDFWSSLGDNTGKVHVEVREGRP